MWPRAGPLLLLLASCLSLAATQSDGGTNIWKDPIQFRNKGGDSCAMLVTGQGGYTRLRLSCQGGRGPYWCEYLGTPTVCRPYSRNPRHYFTQIMWGLRKLQHPCQGPQQIKPQMCKKSPDESQMVFSSASSSPPSRPHTSSGTGARVAAQLARLRPPTPTGRDSARRLSPKSIPVPPVAGTTQGTGTGPTAPPAMSDAKRIAEQYCWRSLRRVCSYVIGLFQS